MAEGAVSDTIRFRSGASSPTPYDWYGINMVDGARAFEPKHCKFEHAVHPIICAGDTLAVDHCFFRSFGLAGVWASDSSVVTIENSTIDMTNASMAAVRLSNSSGVVTGNIIQGVSGPTALYAIDGSSVNVSHNTMSGVYTGIEAGGGSLTSSHNRISGVHCDGILVSGGTVSISYDTLELGSTGVRGIELTSTTSGTVSHNYITSSTSGMRYGIETSDYAVPVIEYNKIDGPKYGIKCTDDSSPEILHNWIKNTTGNGLQFSGDAGAIVRYTTIESFQGTAVWAGDYSIPDLGAAPDSGSNRIYTSQSFSYYVADLAQDPLSAEYNWWGTSSPSSKKFYGSVDYVPYDATDPGTSYSLPLTPVVASLPVLPYAMQSYPNPFNPRTTIEYGVSEPGTHVKVAVYDISGRMVRKLVDELKTAGRFTVVWDGRDEGGGSVASGVYFYEVVIGDFRQAKKLVVLR